MKRNIRLTIIALVALLGGSQLGRWKVLAAQGKQPLLVHYVVTNLTAPVGQQKTERVFARSADGSTVETWQNPTPEGSKVAQRRIRSTTLRQQIDIEGDTKSLMIDPLGDKLVTILKTNGARSTCPGEPQTQEILGRTVYMMEQIAGSVNVPHSHKRRTWRAPSLGCVLLQSQSFVSTDSGEWQLTSERLADSIQIGEPPANMFEVPSYPPRKIADVNLQLKQQFGR